MANYFDHLNLNGSEADLKSVDFYAGQDLTAVHADEIANYSDPFAWIRERIKVQDWSKLHVGDYIPFTATNGVKMNAQIAGIDPYYNYGDSATGHHIDFITKELWPTAFAMNLVNFNNGVSAENMHEWLCCNGYAFINSLAMDVPNEAKVNPALTAVDYTTDGIYYFLPDALKAQISEKRVYLPCRYNSSTLQNNETGGAWQNIGKLWLPSETEITGTSVLGGTAVQQSMGYIQYPIFANNMNRVKLRNGGRSPWWTSSAYGGRSSFFVCCNSGGLVNASGASGTLCAPVCFRISA